MDRSEEDRWLRRDCHVLALALHRRTGWPIMSLHDGRITNSRMAMHEPGMLVHSGLLRPDGAFVDARGAVGASELGPIEDAYVHYHETWARWMHSDCGDFTLDEFREAIPGDGEGFERALADAEEFIGRALRRHIDGFPLTPVPDAGQLRDPEAEDEPANPGAIRWPTAGRSTTCPSRRGDGGH